METIAFKPAERKIVEDAFRAYNQTVDIICKLMTAEGRIPDNAVLSVAPDRSGFDIQKLATAEGPIEISKAS
jgi:hypothetical protein